MHPVLSILKFRRLLLLMLLTATVGAGAAESGTAPAAMPKRIKGQAPEYPAIARRWNIEGVVLVKVTINTEGRVESSEILESPADVLSDAVRRVLSDWRYTKPAAAVEAAVRFPFWLSGGGPYPYDTTVRPMTFRPERRNEIAHELVDGWANVRLMIDQTGAVAERYVMRTSGNEFRASMQAIIDTLRFAPASTEVAARAMNATTVNAFSVRVMGSQVRVDQYAGSY